MPTKKKPAVTKPAAKARDLKARKDPKGGGVIVYERGGGSATQGRPNMNHNETLVSSAG